MATDDDAVDEKPRHKFAGLKKKKHASSKKRRSCCDIPTKDGEGRVKPVGLFSCHTPGRLPGTHRCCYAQTMDMDFFQAQNDLQQGGAQGPTLCPRSWQSPATRLKFLGVVALASTACQRARVPAAGLAGAVRGFSLEGPQCGHYTSGLSAREPPKVSRAASKHHLQRRQVRKGLRERRRAPPDPETETSPRQEPGFRDEETLKGLRARCGQSPSASRRATPRPQWAHMRRCCASRNLHPGRSADEKKKYRGVPQARARPVRHWLFTSTKVRNPHVPNNARCV